MSRKTLLAKKSQIARHVEKSSELKERFSYAPFFLPGIHSVTLFEVSNKQHNISKLNLLFVGREGKRKGLNLLIDALGILNQSERGHYTLTVDCTISRFEQFNNEYAPASAVKQHMKIFESALCN